MRIFVAVMMMTFLIETALWSEILTNKILVSVATIIFFLELGMFIKFIPDFIYSFSTTNASVSMSNNYSFSRTRDYLCLPHILVIGLVADGFDLYRSSLLSSFNSSISSLLIIGIFSAYILLRLICYLLIRPRKMSSQHSLALRKTAYSYFIVLGLCLLVTSTLAWLLNFDYQIVRFVLWGEIGLFYLLSLVRSYKILRLSCSGISSFLYLCGLEFLPSAVLIFSSLI